MLLGVAQHLPATTLLRSGLPDCRGEVKADSRPTRLKKPATNTPQDLPGAWGCLGWSFEWIDRFWDQGVVADWWVSVWVWLQV